ncbi:16S rRNA (guanine(966)-N(2))-methyltransferase RsmD [Flavobacterium agricola]|uniref:16S rRNA (Guanine(966)-N(2))-methyltransferase RsmD n=1 Tax=Flavobacterium agricola TaxID=2870839 RepID=A0ABY6M1T3_9FLAO|nr:16S rRNA (guanine(966)-N(2))-methyltransferase RsmD [Flavobacterium agricola]UYW02207.1 16S rRNA (guanine(966)-N(2))-methyltransferase RsmD [Flavobacterium agricola]
MRIISGKYKGRKIDPPKNLPVRPTTDMAKEALFNILNNHFNLTELKVLDLFAGTGSVSFEFASRGSKPIVSVDGDMGCVNFIKKVTKEFDFDISAVKSDVIKFLERHQATYDIIFVDPPYDFSDETFKQIIDLIFENELLDEEGMLVVEHSKHTNLENIEHHSFDRNYGGTVFSFFEYEFEEDEDEDDDVDDFETDNE